MCIVRGCSLQNADKRGQVLKATPKYSVGHLGVFKATPIWLSESPPIWPKRIAMRVVRHLKPFMSGFTQPHLAI